MKRFRRLAAAVREVFHPQPWDPPERDETTPQLIASWIGRHKHQVTIDDLTAYRRAVEKGWSPDTSAYPWRVGCGPRGQCGVTAAWLQEQLMDREIQSWFHQGAVDVGDVTYLDHCWLEIDGVVVDITGDQFGLPEVVYGAPEGVVYRGVPYSPPLARLEVLKAALEGVRGVT